MADVINIADRRKKEKPPLEELITQAVEFIQQDWEKFARGNKLNDFFTSFASVWVDPGVSYMNDLNSIGVIEQKLGITIVVRSPFGGQMGWRAASVFSGGTAWTPDMPFESYARCFNVLLFIKLKRDLLANDMVDQL